MRWKYKSLESWDAHKPKVHFSEDQQFVPSELGKFVHEWGYNRPVMTDATEEVYRQYKMPYKLYPYQEVWVNAFADKPTAGMYFQVGLGKTSTATVTALYHKMKHGNQTIVLMPPILIRQWYNWLNSIGGIQSVLMYQGTPTQRVKLELDAEFILMSMDIFKRDFNRIYSYFEDKPATLIVDEAVCVKNPTTLNHKCVWAFQNLDRSKVPAKQVTKNKQQTQKEKIKTDTIKPSESLKADLLNKLKQL